MTATAVAEIALVDLPGIAHAYWHMSTGQPDPDWTSQQIHERIRSLTAQHPQAAICCDSGRTFRHDISPEYKAQRPERDAILHHQIAMARERLQADGYPVWAVPGFEADDLIASAVTIAMGLADTNVVIFSADKDLLQLVGPRVRTVSPANGKNYDEAAVVEKHGVKPSQMRDYLALVGDASDNVKGAKGIGPKTAALLLNTFESLEGLYAAMNTGEAALKPAVTASLVEFSAVADVTQQLIALRTDVDLPFADIFTERQSIDAAQSGAAMAELDYAQEQAAPEPAAATPAAVTTGASLVPERPAPAPVAPTQAQAVRDVEVLPPPAEQFEMQLEPRSLGQAFTLAKSMHTARMFSGYGSPDAVLSTIMAGRELGLQSIASLRSFHIVEGKHVMAADLLRALVLKSGLAEYFRIVERTNDHATFTTKRKDDPEPVTLTFSVEDGKRAAGILDPELSEKERADRIRKFMASGWGKNPADMCVARAGSKLVRLVYPEVTHGLYCGEELE